LVKEHAHSVNAAVTGLSALPATALPMAAIKAMSRFLNHENVTRPALIEPLQEAIREAVDDSIATVALVVHDWCMFSFRTHTSKTDCLQRTHDRDIGYDLGTALVVDAGNGQPLGPVEFRLRTANGILSTRPGDIANPPAHIDELADVMADAHRWNLGRPLVHIVDREADSVGHYRDWHAAGHSFLVRAKSDRRVLRKCQSITLKDLQTQMACDFRDPPGGPALQTTKHGRCRVQVLETAVILDRPAKTWIDGVQKEVSGPPLPLRLVLTRVIDAVGVVRAEWLLLTNVAATFDATTIARWYAWRWRIESYHKLLKTAGMNAEEWQQESGDAFANRLIVASMACLTVWHLRQDTSDEATQLKGILIRLSGRQMKYGVKDTAPALLAGLEKLLAVVDLLESHDLEAILTLARRLLPNFFNSA
jgi:Transposase DDE domain